MTGPEHYREAERLTSAIGEITGKGQAKVAGIEILLAAAQVHATLANAAATAQMAAADGALSGADADSWDAVLR